MGRVTTDKERLKKERVERDRQTVSALNIEDYTERKMDASPDGRLVLLFFFFQAEDGIRDVAVTGVQTCALPISAGSTTAPAGVPGHWSRPSSTPSPSASAGQPLASTRAPAGVPGHWSRPSSTPSPSASAGEPLAVTCAPAGVPGHWASPSHTPARAGSGGQPRASAVAPAGGAGA